MFYVIKRFPSGAELDQHASKRPDVCFETNASIQLLGGHVSQSALAGFLGGPRLVKAVGDSEVDELDLLVVPTEYNIRWLQILMYYAVLVEVPQPRYELPAYFLHRLNGHRPALLFEILFHVFPLHELEDDVELVILGVWVELPHEVFVLYYCRVHEGLGYVELIIHVFHRLVSKLRIVVDLPHLVNELPWHPTDLNLKDISLSSRAQLLYLSDVQGAPRLLARAVEYLDVQALVYLLEGFL